MQNGGIAEMKVVHPSGSIQSYLSLLLPGEGNLFVLQNAPKTTPLAVLLDDGEFGWLDSGSEEHHDVRVSETLHGVTFREKVFEGVVRILGVHLEHLDCHDGLSPFRLVDYPVATLGDLGHILEFVVVNFEVAVEGSAVLDLVAVHVDTLDFEFGL